MKHLALFLLVTVPLTLFATLVSADCNCAAIDTTCLETCVTSANQCIANCQGNSSCYTNCIENYWPTSVSGLPSMTASASPSSSLATALPSMTAPSGTRSGSATQSATATSTSGSSSGAAPMSISAGLMALVLLSTSMLLQQNDLL